MAGGQRLGDSAMTLGDWMAQALDAVALGEPTFVTAHLDELGLEHATWEQSGDVLAKAIDQLPIRWHGRLSVALPLRETPTLCTAPPADLRGAADPREPPSLYVFSGGHFDLHPTEGEEFHASVPTPIDVGGRRVRSEFVSSRDADSAGRGWDFVNTLWIHYLGAFLGKS